MKISVVHPSRGRVNMASETMGKFLGKASYADGIEYLLMCDTTDPDIAQYQYRFGRRSIALPNKSAIEAINNGALHSTGNLIVVVSDDFDCPQNWDTMLLSALQGKSDYLVKTQDGIQPTLITLPIMDRAYYNRFGYVYHPDYKHMFSDQEMTAVGHMLCRVIDLPIHFPHNHYSTGKTKRDSINIKNDLTWKQGQALFNDRLKTNFGIENPVIPYGAIKWQ